jgi:hypothetical protein
MRWALSAFCSADSAGFNSRICSSSPAAAPAAAAKEEEEEEEERERGALACTGVGSIAVQNCRRNSLVVVYVDTIWFRNSFGSEAARF